MQDPYWETINYGTKGSDPMPMEVRACITFYTEKYAVQQLTGGLPVLSCIGVVDKLFPPENYLPDYMIPEEKPYTWGSFIWDFASAGISIGQCATGFVPGVGTVVSYGLSVVGGIIDYKENSAVNEGCWRKFKKLHPTHKDSRSVYSMDPNELVGPQGFTSDNYISSKGNVDYRIYFENKDTASSSALEAFVKDTLNTSRFDLSTFSFNTITIADTTVKIQDYAKEFTILVDMYPKKDIIVQVHGIIDTLNGAISWDFHSLDRITLELTDDPDLGFLSPNVTPPEGEANVSFSCKLKKAIAHDAIVTNNANIVFDFNAPMNTNSYSNKIDTIAPVSSVNNLNLVQPDSVFTVGWSGSDQGCGIFTYSIFVSENDSDYVLWKTTTANNTSDVFKGHNGSNYKFFSIASDSIGLTEKEKLTYDAMTTVSVQVGIKDVNKPAPQVLLYPTLLLIKLL